MSRSKFDVPHENECRECSGRGYTQFTAQRGAINPATTAYETAVIGSGCPTCHGVGRTESK